MHLSTTNPREQKSGGSTFYNKISLDLLLKMIEMGSLFNYEEGTKSHFLAYPLISN